MRSRVNISIIRIQKVEHVHWIHRKSTREQNSNLQIAAVKKLGVDRIYVDKMTGRSMDRPEFSKMKEVLREGGKPMMLVDSEDSTMVATVIESMLLELPHPKKR